MKLPLSNHSQQTESAYTQSRLQLACFDGGSSVAYGEINKNTLLGLTQFNVKNDADSQFGIEQQIPSAKIFTPLLAPQTEISSEAWRCDSPLQAGQEGDLKYRYNDDWLMGYLVVNEGIPTSDITQSNLRQISQQAYAQLFALMQNLDFPHLLRVWNYIAEINHETLGLERYRQFNLGRQDAFEAYGRTQAESIPAACALGTIGQSEQPQLVIYFLAGKTPAIAIENPRQVPAYHYPSEYGPRSPLFSRASLLPCAAQTVLFISGTASIVGHQTVHLGDVVAQTEESLNNIQALLDEATQRAKNLPIIANEKNFLLSDLMMKVYLRHPSDVEKVQAVIQRRVGQPAHLIFLHAEVCRADLLVEIEGTAIY